MSSPRPATMLALGVIVVIALVASCAIQVLVLQAAIRGLAGPQAVVLIAMLLVVAGILCLQVLGVSVLRFLGHVRRGTALTAAARRPLDVTAVAIAAGGVVLLALAVDGSIANRTTHGDEVAPGIVGLLCGFALVAVGVALVVRVLRAVLEGAELRIAAAEGQEAGLPGTSGPPLAP